MFFSVGLYVEGLNYSRVLQRHTGQIALLQALTLGHIKSSDNSATKIFVDNFFSDNVD